MLAQIVNSESEIIKDCLKGAERGAIFSRDLDGMAWRTIPQIRQMDEKGGKAVIGLQLTTIQKLQFRLKSNNTEKIGAHFEVRIEHKQAMTSLQRMEGF